MSVKFYYVIKKMIVGNMNSADLQKFDELNNQQLKIQFLEESKGERLEGNRDLIANLVQVSLINKMLP